MMELNMYQSSLEDLNIDNQETEIKEQFYDFINNVPNIRNYISLKRPRARDLGRDEEGKIIVDVTEPHILEDMDYFRPAALHYKKYGCYTKLRPNRNPNSEYYKWVREEVRRCWYGYIRKSDGEWITGDFYFYLNYCPILLIKKNKSGINTRVIDFPKVWDGQYYKFHFLNQCRKQGFHYMELASRGKGKSFSGASLLAKRFILGESEDVQEKVQCMVTASEKKYLVGGNQILNMFQSYIDFNSKNSKDTNFPYMRTISSLQNMQWTMGYVNNSTKAQGGTQNSVTGITSKDDESKLRGTRGVLYIIEESGTFPRLLKLWSVMRPSVEDGKSVFGTLMAYGCVCAGTKVLDESGSIRNIEDIEVGNKLLGFNGECASVEDITWKQPEAYKECLHIITEKNNELKCSIDHPILALNKDRYSHNKSSCSFYRADELKTGDILLIPRYIGVKQERLDSYMPSTPRRRYAKLKFELRDNGKGKYYKDRYLYNLQGVTIKSIENIGEQRIYNLTANTTHTYITNGFVSSNTAGDNNSDFSSMQEMMYNPDGYNLKGVRNVFDKEGQGRAKFTYFYPAYLNMAECYDDNGNSDVTKALLNLLKERYKIKYNSTDINAITKRIAEYPITPQEAIIRANGNIFPVTQLNERLNEIDNNPAFYNDTYVGELVQNSEGKIEFNPTTDIPIRDFPTKDNKVTGAIEIYEMPQKVHDKIPRDRYIASLDNYDNDTANTMSLGSLFVLDLWTDRIVAEYTGRPMFSDDLNEVARKMCLFYNCKLLYENNRRSTFAYFSKMNSLYLLEDTPEYLRQKDLIKSVGYGNSSKGVTATVPIKNHGFTLIRDWLLKPVPMIIKENNEEHEVTVPNLHFLKNRALIKELILFNPDINVDRIMSLVQLMIFRESKLVLYRGDFQRDMDKIEADYAGNDPFFNNNYRSYKQF